MTLKQYWITRLALGKKTAEERKERNSVTGYESDILLSKVFMALFSLMGIILIYALITL